MTASDPRPEPSRGYRWLVLLFVSTAMFGNYYVFDALNPVGPLLEKQLGFTQAQIGSLDSAYNVAALLVLLLGGVLIDRAGTKRAMVAFGAVTALGGLLIALFPGYAGMAAGRFVLGLGAEPLIVAATTVLGRWFKGKELAFAMAVNLVIARLGSYAADSSSSWAAPLFTTWQRPLLLAAGVGLTCILGGAVYALLERHAERRFALGRGGPTDKLVPGDLVRFGRAYWWVVGLCVTFYSAVFPFRRFANIFFIDAHGATPEAAGRLNGLLPLTAMFATPLFGLLVDRIGRRALLMAAGSLLLLPAFLLMAHTRLPLWLPVALMGTSFSLIPAVMWPSVTYLVDEKRLGTAYALMTFCQQIGWAAMAWAVGFSNDSFGAGAANPGGYAPGMWLFSALGLLGLFFSVRLWRAERGPGAHGLEAVRPKG
ncbi:MAG TPA: MFS transporter [Anaeromyxobacteraceae bacterium]